MAPEFCPRNDVSVLRSLKVPSERVPVEVLRVDMLVLPPRDNGEDAERAVVAVRVGVEAVRSGDGVVAERELLARRELFGAARVMVGTPLLVVRVGALR